MRTNWPLYLACLVCLHEPVLAQTAAPAVTVPDSHVHNFKSAINGNDYQLFVFLPADYDKTKKNYHVLYLLDGNAWQAAYAAIQRITMGGDMPNIILVGVGYQGEADAQQDDVVEVERREELCDECRGALHRQLGLGPHRLGVGAQRPGGSQAAQSALREQSAQRPPERRGHHVAVDEDHPPAVLGPRGFVVNRSGAQLDAVS